MRVHLIRKGTVEVFAQQNAQSRHSFDEWLARVRYADWETPADIQVSFPGADLLGRGSGRVVFNIGGNRYRMIGKYAFGDRQVHLFICWLGTHADYDKLCNAGEQYNVNNY